MGNIDATRVVVFKNPTTGQMEILPYWDDTRTIPAILDAIEPMAIRFADKCGSGYVEVSVIVND
jgi:hypothetical protein